MNKVFALWGEEAHGLGEPTQVLFALYASRDAAETAKLGQIDDDYDYYIREMKVYVK